MDFQRLYVISPLSDEYNLISEFLCLYEQSCVNLMSLTKKKSEHIFVVSKKHRLSSAADIWGVLYVQKTVFHCLPYLPILDSTNFYELAADFFYDKNVKCINGERQGTELLVKIIQEKSGAVPLVNYYDTMVLENPPLPPPEKLCNSDEIRRCIQTDYEELFLLQKEYLQKEVAPAGKQISALECAASLKQILKNQLVFALFSDGSPYSKANTNAIGENYVQIGGVFTSPTYRKNYYAWHLVYTLCTRIQKSKKNPCLFVKEKNNAAKRLYEKIGFNYGGKFSIAYF